MFHGRAGSKALLDLSLFVAQKRSRVSRATLWVEATSFVPLAFLSRLESYKCNACGCCISFWGPIEGWQGEMAAAGASLPGKI